MLIRGSNESVRKDEDRQQVENAGHMVEQERGELKEGGLMDGNESEKEESGMKAYEKA